MIHGVLREDAARVYKCFEKIAIECGCNIDIFDTLMGFDIVIFYNLEDSDTNTISFEYECQTDDDILEMIK